MIVRVYDFEVSGVNGYGNTWKVAGTMVDSFTPIDFPKLTAAIVSEVFLKLTKGKATFGEPGKSCSGPYQYKKILIELKEELTD